MNRKILRIDKTGLLCALSLIPMLKMGSFSVLFPAVDTLFDMLKIVDLIILALAALIRMRQNKKTVVDIIFVLTLLYSIHIIFVTGIYGGSVRYAIIHCAGLFLMYFWVFLFFGSRKTDLKYVVWLFVVILLIDLATKILYPNGLFVSYTFSGKWMSDQNWFLGFKNNYFPIIGFAFLIVYNLRKRKGITRIRTILIYVLFAVEILYVSRSASAIVALSMICLFFLIHRYRFVNSRKILLAYCIANVAILLLFVIPSGNREVFLEIGKYFGKYDSIVSRFSLWQQAMDGISASPIWGLGFSSGNPDHPLANCNAHNRYLWGLVTVGVLGSLVLLALIITIIKKIYCNYSSEYSHMLGWIIFVILTVWQVETYENVAMFIYGMLIICYYSCPVEKNIRKVRRWNTKNVMYASQLDIDHRS